MTRNEIEEFIKKFPIYQYEFALPSEIEYSSEVRNICKIACRHYGTSWSCPPAVGKIDNCREHCLRYDNALVISTVTTLEGKDYDRECAEAQKDHARLTRLIDTKLRDEGYVTFALSSGPCRLCGRCTFPRDYCRHEKDVFPCVESQGISISQLAKLCDMDYYMEDKLLLLFSVIFYKDTGFVDHS